MALAQALQPCEQTPCSECGNDPFSAALDVRASSSLADGFQDLMLAAPGSQASAGAQSAPAGSSGSQVFRRGLGHGTTIPGPPWHHQHVGDFPNQSPYV